MFRCYNRGMFPRRDLAAFSFALVAVIGGAAACTPAARSGHAADSRPPMKFGEAISQSPSQPLATVLAQADAYAGKTVLVDGKVRANCTRKGCWMEVADGMDKTAAGCRVTFKDYGFFVPTDAMGADARVEGTVTVRTVPPAEIAHLESEGGSFPNKQADGTAKEIRIVASGVELRR